MERSEEPIQDELSPWFTPVGQEDRVEPEPEEQTLRLAGVGIANVNPGTVSSEFCQSIQNLRIADVARGWQTVRAYISGRSGAQISKARNEIVSRFLSICDDPATPMEWLLFLDSDMVVPEDLTVRLQMAAKHANAEVVGGLCVMVTERGAIPTLFQHDNVPGSKGFTRVQLDYPQDAIVEVAATGAACLMIHKNVLRRMRDSYGDDLSWFGEFVAESKTGDRHWVSEDITFCLRAREHGARVVVDTGVHVGHAKHGRVWWPNDVKDGDNRGRPKTAVVIPTKQRGWAAAELAGRILDEGPGSPDLVIICDNGMNNADSMKVNDVEAEYPSRMITLPCKGMGIHEMWNAAALRVMEVLGDRTHIAFLNDDIDPCPGFVRLLSDALVTDRRFLVVSGNYDGRHDGVPVQETKDTCGGRYDGTGGVAGFAFMVRSDLFTSGYRFPEECMWWFGDNDLINTLNISRMVSPTSAETHHAGIVLAAKVTHLDTTGNGPGGGSVEGDWQRTHGEQISHDYGEYVKKWNSIWSRFAEEHNERAVPQLPTEMTGLHHA